MDLGELNTRRLMALTRWDVEKVGERMERLQERIWEGENKRKGVQEPERIRRIEARLKELRAELKKLEREHDIPTEVCDWTFHIAESLTKRGLPAGSRLQISIPGIINLEVDLANANEPPF